MNLKRFLWHTLSALTLTATVAAFQPAMAAMYGYIDNDGRVHISSKLDPRYQPIPPGQTLQPAKKTPSLVALKPARPVEAHPARVGRYRDLVEQVADKYDLNPDLMHAIISVESGYNPKAVSNRGARGLMQLMPATGKRFGGRQLSDPKQNLEAGARYLAYLLDKFDNRLTLAIAAYNAGEGAVQRYGTVPPYKETRNYVAKVMATYVAASSDDTPSLGSSMSS